MCNSTFYDALAQNYQDCEAVFNEIKDKLHNVGQFVEDEHGKAVPFELKSKGRFTWPFKQARLTLLRGNLNRLKADMNLKMSIMSHRRSLCEKKLLDR